MRDDLPCGPRAAISLVREGSLRAKEIQAHWRPLTEHDAKAQQIAPILSTRGVQLYDVPTSVLALVQEAWFEARYVRKSHTPDDGGGFVLDEAGNAGAELLSAPVRQIEKILHHPDMLALVGEFCRQPVEATGWYGPRRYRTGARLLPHVDRTVSHVFGVSLLVETDHFANWPLIVRDGETFYEVVLETGLLVCFEAMRLPHGRPFPYQGENYVGLYLHYRPKAFEHQHSAYCEAVSRLRRGG